MSDRFGRRSLIAAGWLIYALVYAGFGIFDSPAVVIAIFLAYGLYFGLTEGVEKAWVADMAPAPPRGTAFGVYNAALGIGGLAASLLFGLIWTRVSPQAAFLTGAALAVAASALLYLLTPPARSNVLMKRILVTNDDGVHSDGIHVLAAALAPLGEVIVVAPHIEASAIGHALTLRRPLRMEPLRDGVYEVDGTPTDCVNIALTQLYTPPHARPHRLRHQQGLQPRRRRDVFGDRVGRAGRIAAGGPQHGGVARAERRRRTTSRMRPRRP